MMKDDNSSHFKVLKKAQRDLLMNHDLFLNPKLQPNTENSSVTPVQIIHFAENALLKLIEIKKWPRHDIDIETQI